MGSAFSFVIVLIYMYDEHTAFQNSDVLQNEKVKINELGFYHKHQYLHDMYHIEKHLFL